MLKVTKTKVLGKNEFWVYNPVGGRGRYCVVMPDGSVKDKENSMFLETSPACYQKAVKAYLREAAEGL